MNRLFAVRMSGLAPSDTLPILEGARGSPQQLAGLSICGEIVAALRADAREQGAVTDIGKARFRRACGIEVMVVGEGHIVHAPAFPADDVGVPVRPPVKAVAAWRFDRTDQARFLEKIEIAVHGTSADFLVQLTNVQIDFICRRVIVVCAHGIEHKRALARVASLNSHGDPSRCIVPASPRAQLTGAMPKQMS